jgi:hypothetical protein
MPTYMFISLLSAQGIMLSLFPLSTPNLTESISKEQNPQITLKDPQHKETGR